MRVRELGDHEGFWPETKATGGTEPSAAITQMLKSPICDVNAIHLPSGDQSGSVGFSTPAVESRWGSPPPAGTLARARRPPNFAA
jgi:hypothetical protein